MVVNFKEPKEENTLVVFQSSVGLFGSSQNKQIICEQTQN